MLSQDLRGGVTTSQAADTAEAVAPATVTYEWETIKVAPADKGDAPYRFYTTAKVKQNSIPANQKWSVMASDEDDPDSNTTALSLSSWPKGTTLYFAQNPNPSYDEVVEVVVPAQPILGKITYKFNDDSSKVTDIFKVASVTYSGLDKTSGKVKTQKNTNITAENAAMRFNGGTAKEYIDNYLPDDQKNGAKAWVYYSLSDSYGYDEKGDLNVPEGFNTAVGEEKNDGSATKPSYNGHFVYTFANAQDSNAAGLIGSGLRFSKEASVKITKRAAGPAVTIDYENHRMKLAKNMQALQITDKYNEDIPESGASWSAPAAAVTTMPIAKKTTDGIEEDVYYAVRTKKSGAVVSMPTYVRIAPANPFGVVNHAVITINGAYSEASDAKTVVATMTITQDAVAAATGYQYALVEKSSLAKYWNDGAFDLDAAASGDTKLTWSKLNVAKNKTSVSVALKGNKLNKDKKQYCIFVRAAATKNAFSSKVVLLTPPEDAAGSWRIQKEGQGSDDAVSAMYVPSTLEYTPATADKAATISFTAKNVDEEECVLPTTTTGEGEAAVTTVTPWNVKIGTKTYALTPAFSEDSDTGTITVILKLETVTDGKAVAIDVAKATKCTLSVPANVFTGTAGEKNTATTLTGTFKTAAANVITKSAVGKNTTDYTQNTVTFKVSEDVKFVAGGTEITLSSALTTATDISADDIAKFITAKQITKAATDSAPEESTSVAISKISLEYKSKARYITVTYTAPEKTIGDNLVFCFTNITDIYNNTVASDVTFQNPVYDKSSHPVVTGASYDVDSKTLTITTDAESYTNTAKAKKVLEEASVTNKTVTIKAALNGEGVELAGNLKLSADKKKIEFVVTGDISQTVLAPGNADKTVTLTVTIDGVTGDGGNRVVAKEDESSMTTSEAGVITITTTATIPADTSATTPDEGQDDAA